MGYTSKNKFSPLTDIIGLVIDGCGNDYNDKHYYNGKYIDLCGLPVEEYMKNPCCGGGGSGDNPTPSKTKNQITVVAIQDEETGMIFYRAKASYAVTSNLKIQVESTTGVITELDIYAGEIESKPEVGDSMEIVTIKLDVTEDDNYKYVPLKEGEIMEYDVYGGSLLKSWLPSINEGDIKGFSNFKMTPNTTVDLKFIVPATDFNYNNVSDEIFNKFCEENQYSFVLILPSSIYNENKYTITNYGGDDVKGKFGKEGNITFGDEDFVVLAEYGKDDIMPYVPLYNEEHMFEYKFTLN